MRQIDYVLQPCFGTEGMDIVVIAELVALAHAAVGIVEVVLQVLGRYGNLTVGERVDVEPELAAEQVAHGLVVRTACVVEANACLQRHHIVYALIDVGVQHQVDLMVDAVLHNV